MTLPDPYELADELVAAALEHAGPPPWDRMLFDVLEAHGLALDYGDRSVVDLTDEAVSLARVQLALDDYVTAPEHEHEA